MEQERWAPVAGFPHYEVSDHGRVRSLDRIVLRPHRNGTLVEQPRRGKILKLGFGEGFVTMNGEPLAQASQAEKIRVSVAIAAAMNPQLRVARILDGSLLDAKSWDALARYAAEADLQVWVETVTQHGAAAVHIADGGVVADVADPAPPVAVVGDVV